MIGIVDIHKGLAVISIKSRMIAVGINNILDITLYSGGRTALIGFNVETDLFFILLGDF